MVDQKDRPLDRQTPHPEPSQLNQVDHTPTVETPVEVRGGFLGKPVTLVLGVSLVLAVLAGILVGMTS